MIAALRPNSGLCVFRDPTSAFYSPTATMRTVFPLGRIMKAGRCRVRYQENRTPTHGYEATPRTREGGVREELAAGVVRWTPKIEVEATSILPSLNGKTRQPRGRSRRVRSSPTGYGGWAC